MSISSLSYVIAVVFFPLALIQLAVTIRLLRKERERAKNRAVMLEYIRKQLGSNDKQRV